MSRWSITSEEISIVLVGSFNTKIFHPEWMIRKGIVEEWDYSNDELVNIKDFVSKFTLPGDLEIEVQPQRFILRTNLSSNNFWIRDMVLNIFSYLPETPVYQLGMNYTTTIHIAKAEDYKFFGSELAPDTHWANFADYMSDEQKKFMGLWQLTYQLPRPDDYAGYIHAKIENIKNQTHSIKFSVNNHVDIEENIVDDAVAILEKDWISSLDFCKRLINSIMESHLRSEH